MLLGTEEGCYDDWSLDSVVARKVTCHVQYAVNGGGNDEEMFIFRYLT